MLTKGVQSSLRIHSLANLHSDRLLSPSVSSCNGSFCRPSSKSRGSSHVMAVAVSGDTVPRRLPGRPPTSDDYISHRSRKDYRVVSDALVEEALQMLPAVSPGGAALRKAVDVVQFLLTLWLTKKNLRQVVEGFPEILSHDVAELEKRVRYFMDGGCSAAEVGTALIRAPEILVTPMDRIESLATHVRKTGLSVEKIPRVLLKSPGVFQLDLENSIDTLIGSLSDLCPTEGSLEKMIESQPRLLMLSDSDVAERTAEMAEFGLTTLAISNLCVKKPGVLLIEPLVLRERLLNLRQIFSGRRLPNIFKVAPSLLVVTPDKVNTKYNLLLEYLGDDTARKVVNAFPQALSLSWKKVLLPKFEYLIELGLDPSEVVNFPAYLGYSLHDRIRPRCELLLQEGYKIEAHSQVVKIEHEKKNKRFGRSHREILDSLGTHSVCIQHIVGQKDWEFEEGFGVGLVGMAVRAAAPLFEFEESDADELEQLEQEAGLGDLDETGNEL